jgi:hypothetical protein
MERIQRGADAGTSQGTGSMTDGLWEVRVCVIKNGALRLDINLRGSRSKAVTQVLGLEMTLVLPNTVSVVLLQG